MDVMLLCVDAKRNVKYDKNSFYLEKCKRDYKHCGFRTDNLHIFNQIRGKLFEVYSKEEYLKYNGLAGSIDIFDDGIENEVQPSYVVLDDFDAYFDDYISRIHYKDGKIIRDESAEITLDPHYNGVRFVNRKIGIKFINLLKDIIESSNVKTCVLLVSEQLDRPEKIVGPITLNKFVEMIKKNQIYEHIEYIISLKDENDNYWEM